MASSFLVLVQGSTHRKRRRPRGQAEGEAAQQEDEPASPPGVLPPIPGYEWVQVRETWGRLHLYRHAPRTYAMLQHPHHPLPTGGGEGGGGGGGNGSRWRSASLSFSVGTASGSGSGSGYFLGSGGRGGGLAGAAQEEDDGYHAPFHPARLSTVLLLGCCSSSSSSSGSSAESSGAVDSTTTSTPPPVADVPPSMLSALQLLEGLSVIAPRIAFVHIVRDERHGRTHALVTLDSVEAAEGWVAMLEEETRDLSLGGQSVYVSGVVMVDEPESDALLCCLKSLVDDVGGATSRGAGTGGGGGESGGNGSPEELSQLGTVQVQGPGAEGVRSAYCLAFGPPVDALALLSSLVLLVKEGVEGEEEEEGGGREDGGEGGGESRTIIETTAMATYSSSSSSNDVGSSSSSRESEGERHGQLSLFSKGLESYLAELPTCLQCLDRLDPVAIGMALGSPPAAAAAAVGTTASFLGGGRFVADSSSSGSSSSSSSRREGSRSVVSSSLCATCQKVQIYAHKQKRKDSLRGRSGGGGGGGERGGGGSEKTSTIPTTTTTATTATRALLSLTCNTCGIPENLWICLLCGHVGCGRYTAEHAKRHFHQSGHIFSLELATGRVWDYVEDIFVHSPQSQGGGGGGGGRVGSDRRSMALGARRGGEDGEEEEEEEEEEEGGWGGGGGGREKGPQGKLYGMGAEYSALLVSQLEEQNSYYERLLAKTAADLAQSACQDDQLSEGERKEATQVRAHIARLEEEHLRLMEALREAEEAARQMRARNEGLLHDQKQHMSHLASLRKAIAEAKTSLEAEVADLEAQISDLSFFLRTKEAVQESELEGGGVVIQQSTTTAAPRGGRGGRRRKSGNK